VQQHRFSASREQASEYVAAALEAMEPVATYAEEDGRFRAKTGSYGLATQGYEIEVTVAGNDETATVAASADYVLFGRLSTAPSPEEYVTLFGRHLERAISDDARPTAGKRVPRFRNLDGMAFPSGRTVPVTGVFSIALLLVAALAWGQTAFGWTGSVLSTAVLLAFVAASLRQVRKRRREVLSRPNHQ